MNTARVVARISKWSIVFAVIAFWTASAWAGTHTWTGAGANGLWSTAGNWSGGAPAYREAAPVVLVFPGGAARLTSTNDIFGVAVDQLVFSGSSYTLRGTGSGSNLTLRVSGLLTHNLGGTGNVVDGSLSLTFSSSPTLIVSNTFTIKGQLLGTGGFTKAGAGTLSLSCDVDNEFTGTASVTDGVMALNGGYSFFGGWVTAVSISGSLAIGTTGANATYVVLIHSDQIANTAPVTVGSNGTLYLGGNNDTVGAVTLNGGSIFGDSLETSLMGKLTLLGDVTVGSGSTSTIGALLSLGGSNRDFDVAANASLTISNIVSDGGAMAGVVKTGGGLLQLTASNLYSGNTLISGGTLTAGANGALGTNMTASVNVASGATLKLSSAAIGTKPLSLTGGIGDSLVGAGNSSYAGNITLNGNCGISVPVGADTLTLAGQLGGPGGFTKAGAGTLLLTGVADNNYSGVTYANEGTLKLDGGFFFGIPPNLGWFSAITIPGAVQVGNGTSNVTIQLLSDDQIAAAAPVTLNAKGVLDLNNHDNTLANLILNQGGVRTGTGTLTLAGDITVWDDAGSSTPDIAGKLSLGGQTRTLNVPTNVFTIISAAISDGGASAGIIKDGPGWLKLRGTNTFTGHVSHNAGYLNVESDLALGSPAGSTTVASGATLYLSKYGGGGTSVMTVSEPLVLNASYPTIYSIYSNVLSGPITLVSNATVNTLNNYSTLTVLSPISGAGSLTFQGDSPVLFTGNATNTFTGGLHVLESLVLLARTNTIAVPGPLWIDNYGSLTGLVRSVFPQQIADSAAVYIGFGVLDLTGATNETIGSLSGFSLGRLDLGSSHLVVGDTNSTTYPGRITGLSDAQFIKTGPSDLVLTGTNNFPGATLIGGGRLLVNGILTPGTVGIFPGGTLGGTGTVAQVVAYDTISPGNSPGILNCSNLTFTAQGAPVYVVDITGTNAGSGYDQLNVHGTVNLDVNATQLKLLITTLGATGQTYVIIKNDGVDLVAGYFAGLPEGATLTTSNGTTFSISYHGGDGNDVVLTQTSLATPPQILAWAQLPDGNLQISGNGAPGTSYSVLVNTNLNTSQWLSLGSIIADGSGHLIFTDLQATNFPQRFYRFALP